MLKKFFLFKFFNYICISKKFKNFMHEQQSLFYLANVIKNYKLDRSEVAKLLFPTASNPIMALMRLLKGKGRVLLDQLEILAQYLGVTVPVIYEAGCNMWCDASTLDCLRLIRGIYTAIYKYDARELTILKQSVPIRTEIVPEQFSMQDLHALIETIIITDNE